jgi:hypothetical protein
MMSPDGSSLSPLRAPIGSQDKFSAWMAALAFVRPNMAAGYVSGFSALAGSAIGALASLATSWLTQNAQLLAAQRLQDRARREALYREFIREASRLFGDAFEHTQRIQRLTAHSAIH